MNKNILPITLIILAILAGAYIYVRSGKTGIPAPVPSPEISPGVSNDGRFVTAAPEELPKEITLTVISPKNNVTVKTPTITVKGKTASRAEVFINEAETIADSGGNFSKVLTLDEGENILIVQANDVNGNIAESELIVTYDPGQ